MMIKEELKVGYKTRKKDDDLYELLQELYPGRINTSFGMRRIKLSYPRLEAKLLIAMNKDKANKSKI